MKRNSIITFSIIGGVLIWINFGVGVEPVYREEAVIKNRPHIYNDPSQLIENIEITALYFVPQNKASQQITNWRGILEENLENLIKFHELQFRGRSHIAYSIIESPVIGFKDNIEYDTTNTQHGNPEGLRRVALELGDRDMMPDKNDNNIYRVAYILYEGVGASGSENVALVSRIFYTDPQYNNTKASIFAHEFYHTLGLLDSYDIETAVPESLDIMGLGLSMPLEKNFIARDTLKKMGI